MSHCKMHIYHHSHGKVYIHLEDTLEYLGLKHYIVNIKKDTQLSKEIKDLRVPILMYHHLKLKENMSKDDWNNWSIMSVENFKRNIKFMYERGYKAISFKEYLNAYKGKCNLPEKCVIITFDDGYYSSYKYAYPILKKYGYLAAQFVVTSSVYEDDPYGISVKLPHLTWNLIKKMKDVFSFHTHSHDYHRRENNVAYYHCKKQYEIKNDLLKSHNLLAERNYNQAKILAYPYGDYDDKILSILDELDYDFALTVYSGTSCLADGVYKLKRYSMHNSISNDKLGKMLESN